jgi:prepilin peptidase CpaA
MATLLLLLIATGLAAAAWCDLAVRRIPNALAAVVAVCGLALRAIEGLAPASATLIAAGLLFALLFLGFARGLMGGGDVKLATATALGLPPAGIWSFVVVTALAGGVLSLGYLLMHRLTTTAVAPAGRGQGVLVRVAAAERWRFRRRGPLPYGVAIAIGGLTCFGNQFMML